MTSYLIDTNIVLRLCNKDDVQHQTALESIKYLIQQNDSCFITSQVLIEFWVVATRPISVNGLAWTVQFTVKILEKLLTQFEILEDSPDVFQNWLNLIEKYQVTGKRSHDIRLVAMMQTHDVSHLLTLNPKDFSMITEISVVHPRDFKVE
jgi:predicted nucleic acid-binding protein